MSLCVCVWGGGGGGGSLQKENLTSIRTQSLIISLSVGL